MRNSPTMSPWRYLPLYSWRPNRNRPGQLLPRHRPSRHVLCSSPLPLRPVNRSRICHCCRLCALIPPILRLYPSQHLNKNPLWSNVRRSQPNILPPTLPRLSRNASTVLRLPRRLYPLKHNLFNRLPNLACSRNYVPIHHLRSVRC